MSSYYQYYYSGSQAMIYIGGRYVDELSAIGFNYELDMVPRYHYTHRHPLAIRHGRAHVAGELRINYVHPMYLQLYLKLATGAMTSIEVASRVKQLYNMDINEVNIEDDPYLSAQAKIHKDLSDDEIIAADSLPVPPTHNYRYFSQSFQEQIKDAIGNYREDARKSARAYSTLAEDAEIMSRLAIEADAASPGTNPLSRRNIDIALYWGSSDDPSSPDPRSKGHSTLDTYSAVDIVLNIGQGSSRHVQVIKGCKFAGPQVIVQADAEPIALVYSFMGQSVT